MKKSLKGQPSIVHPDNFWRKKALEIGKDRKAKEEARKEFLKKFKERLK